MLHDLVVSFLCTVRLKNILLNSQILIFLLQFCAGIQITKLNALLLHCCLAVVAHLGGEIGNCDLLEINEQRKCCQQFHMSVAILILIIYSTDTTKHPNTIKISHIYITTSVN